MTAQPTLPGIAERPLGQADTRPHITFVAYRDHGEDMVPASRDGRLLLYPDLEAARDAAGPLGVGSATPWPRIPAICRRHDLALPERTDS